MNVDVAEIFSLCPDLSAKNPEKISAKKNRSCSNLCKSPHNDNDRNHKASRDEAVLDGGCLGFIFAKLHVRRPPLFSSLFLHRIKVLSSSSRVAGFNEACLKSALNNTINARLFPAR
jgi:hypothetical protein